MISFIQIVIGAKLTQKDSCDVIECAKICSNLTSRIEFELNEFPIQFELWEKLI